MILVNYADRGFVKSQKLNSDSGLLHGFDRVINYTNKNIDNDFYKNNSKILSQTKGAGYWLWKPYIILKTLNCVNENSIIFYCDSGAEFIKNMTPIFEQIQKANRGILIFKLSGHHKEKNYTRKDVINYIVGDDKNIIESDQHCASFIGVRNCQESRDIISKWLSLCENPDLLLDDGSNTHRHDQSILSLLSKKLKLKTMNDPSQWGLHHKQTTEKDYFIYHHRKKT